MARVRQSGTAPELAVQKLLISSGYQFHVKGKGLPGSPDILNQSEKWAIFVHGCFWHAHDNCPKWKIPKNNQEYWTEKFVTNRERDERKVKELKRLGFSVLVLWQCELVDESKIKGKILKFMGRVRRNKTKSNGISTQELSNEITDVGKKRETFSYTNSYQCVSRSIMLNEGKVIVTQLPLIGKNSIPKEPQAAFDQTLLRLKTKDKTNENGTTIQAVDLFCGCGGLSLGAKEACSATGHKFESVLAVDMDSYSLEVYKSNFNPKQTYNCDIETLVSGDFGARLETCEKSLRKKLKNIKLVLAGPPCQGNSNLNNHTRRKDERNKLYERVGRFAEIAEPESILIENVPSVIHGQDRALDNTINLLQSLGYKVDGGTIDLSILGVPQRRKRHVLIASIRKSISVQDIVAKYRVSKTRDVKWAISDLEKEKGERVFNTPAKISQENQNRIRFLLENDAYDLPNSLRPPCHQNEEHSYKAMYGRLKYNEPAQTITSGFSSPGQGRYIHPTQPRTLTPHEAARLQFFPDYFDFSSVNTRKYLSRMIGNAVPMKLSYVFCLELLI